MTFWAGSVVAAATGTLIAAAAGTPAAQPSAPVIAEAYARNETLQSYTFHLDVDMAMRTFPWLHFRMEGLGDYLRGNHYLVHLTKKPGFAAKMRDLDLSMIDPSMWPKRYRYRRTGHRGGDTIFALQSLEKHGSLKSADVALNPVSGARWVDATYNDGMHVHMTVTSNDVDGFLLPTSLTADVNYPHMFPMSADASFSNYAITDPSPSPPPVPVPPAAQSPPAGPPSRPAA